MKSNFYIYKIFGTFLLILSTTFLFAQKINLLDYLPYAVTESKQTFINPTYDGSKSFLGMGWGPIEIAKNKNTASRWIVGQKATLTINYDHVQERYLFICIKGLPDAQNQQLTLLLNDVRIAAITLNSSFKIYNFILLSAAQKMNENKITLQFNVFSKLLSPDLAPKGIKNDIPLTAAVRWVTISDDNENNYNSETHYPTDFYSTMQPSPSVIIKSSQKISFFEKIPPRATLHFTSSSFPEQIASTASLDVELKNLSISSTQSFSVKSAKEFIIPLTAFENTVTSISFSMPDKISHKIVSIKLIEPAITYEKQDESFSANDREILAKTKEAIGNDNLIIISLDAASALHFKSYGYFRETTPFLDKLSTDGIMVSNAFANASYTLASVSSLFTGLLPMSHGIIDQNDALPDNAMLLSEYFHKAGFKTAAFGGNYFISHIFGFNQGFDYFYEPPVKELQMHSATIIDKAMEWIDAQKNDKFFMYIHFREPHVPYIPIAPYDSIFWNKSNPSIDIQALKKNQMQ